MDYPKTKWTKRHIHIGGTRTSESRVHGSYTLKVGSMVLTRCLVANVQTVVICIQI